MEKRKSHKKTKIYVENPYEKITGQVAAKIHSDNKDYNL